MLTATKKSVVDENENELELLRIENKDLLEKLETLKQKRKEDHPKLVEYDKNFAELKALREFKAKLIECNAELKRALQEKEKELSEMIKTGQAEHEWLAEIEGRLEIVSIEKQIAEEKSEILQTEIEVEKQHVQELAAELDLVRSKFANKGEEILQGDEMELIQLRCQNEQLREAIARLRDGTGQLMEDKREIEQENEKLRNDSNALAKICESSKVELQNAEQTIAALKEQIEATMDSARMIEMLTEKNLDLETQLNDVEDALEDYKALKALDDEIFEIQEEFGKELKKDIDLANNHVNKLLLKMRAYSERMDGCEKTIVKFHRKIADLNEKIQEKQDEIYYLKEQLKNGRDDKEFMSAQSTQITAAARSFAEFISAEVCSLELKYEIQFSNYLKAFLPDSFSKFGGDGDAVLLSICCSRLVDKSALLHKLLNLKYPTSPGGMRPEHVTKSYKAEQWAHCAKFAFLLSAFGRAVRKCESAIQMCSVERMLRLAQQQNEFVKEERKIDHYIALLKSDKCDENTPTDDIENGIKFFDNVLSVHLSDVQYDTKQMLLDFSTQLLHGLLWIKINVQRIKFFVIPTVAESQIDQFVEYVFTWIMKCEELCMRLKNRTSIETNFLITQEMETHLVDLDTTFRKITSILDNACSIASIQLSTIADREGLEENDIQEALLSSVEKVHGTLSGTEPKEVLSEYMTSVKQCILDLINKLETEVQQSVPEQKRISSLIERARARKQDVLEAEKLRWHLEKKEGEILELKMNIQMKLDDISDYRLRLEMANKKIESLGKIDMREVQKLRFQNDELREQLKQAELEFEEQVQTLQNELGMSEKRNIELKKHLKHMSKKVLLNQQLNSNTSNIPTVPSKNQSSLSPTTPTDSSLSEHLSETEYLESELRGVKQELEWAHRRIRKLKANERMQMLGEMKPVTVSLDICGPITLESAQNSKKEELDELCRRAESILADLRFYQVPYVVDPSQSKSRQESERQNYRNNVLHINQRIADLNFDMHRFWSKFGEGHDLPHLFTNIRSITSDRLKQTNECVAENQVRGVHSSAFKNAFESLFGDFDKERKKREFT